MTYAKCHIADGCQGDEGCAALCPNTRPLTMSELADIRDQNQADDRGE